MAARVNRKGLIFKYGDGQDVTCHGHIDFSAGGDTYTTANGVAGAATALSLLQLIRKAFGVNRVKWICFPVGGSDAGMATGKATARFNPTTGKISLYKSGKENAGALSASEVEVADASSINAARFDFYAVCVDGAHTGDMN